eukprot:165345-Amphidinium_carterae.1
MFSILGFPAAQSYHPNLSGLIEARGCRLHPEPQRQDTLRSRPRDWGSFAFIADISDCQTSGPNNGAHVEVLKKSKTTCEN